MQQTLHTVVLVAELWFSLHGHVHPRHETRYEERKPAAAIVSATFVGKASTISLDTVRKIGDDSVMTETVTRLVAIAKLAYPKIDDTAFVEFVRVLEAADNDLEEWTGADFAGEFSFWVSGARMSSDDEGGPKQEWIDAWHAAYGDQAS